MTDQPVPESLDLLRREIDRIDDAIHDLIMERTAIVERVRAAKRNGVILRPGREAAILRRLLDRHDGHFPKASVVRIWREIISALTNFQAPLTLAVYMPERGAGFLALARDQYGAYTQTQTYASAGQVARAVMDGEASVGILPVPLLDDDQAWWTMLVGSSPDLPRVVARLPFHGPGAGRGDGLEAMAVGKLPLEPTGDDRTMLAVECSNALSRAGLRSHLEAVGLGPNHLWDTRENGPDARIDLIAVEDFVAADDPRLAAVLERPEGEVAHVHVIGAYATPYPV
ncbi:chorismate mutase [Caenispirillum bisanense]